MANKKLPLGLNLKYKVFDKLLYSKLKETLGLEKTRVFGSAGAPLLPEYTICSGDLICRSGKATA